MSKRTVFTTISPLPGGISRDFVIDFLHNHVGMIDLNPLVKERHPIKPPPEAPADETNCIWYSLTDRITYLPGGLAGGDISYTCAFHDLPDGIQTHCRAPLGVDIREKWTLNGTLPGEPPEPVELGIGAPATGLYIREDVDLRCNFLMAGFVRKNLTKAHAKLVDRLVERAKLVAAKEKSTRTSRSTSSSAHEQARPLQPQPQPQPLASAPAPHATAYDIRRKAAPWAKSPPPQLGSPFIAGYQPAREPSPRGPSPHEARKSPDGPAGGASHRKSHSQDSFKSRLQAYGDHHPDEAPLPLRLGHQPQHLSLPPHYDPALYPQPLRLRNASVGSGQSAGGSGHAVPSPDLNPPPGGGGGGTTGTSGHHSRPSVSEPRSSTDHPAYPQLGLYSGAGSSPAESPAPPRTPQFIAELTGVSGLPFISDSDYPAALRPGGAGASARPKSPFISELE
jgi:hypothetical protein